MKAEILRFTQLRVYKGMTTLQILNSMICNRIMKMPTLVRHSRSMYQFSTKLLGKKIVNSILTRTFCRVLTAGNTLQEANTVSEYFRKQKIPVILDYCAEGQLHHSQIESVQDANAAMFARSAQNLQNQTNQMISIKITGLINMSTLKILNDSVLMRDRFWEQNNQNGKLKAEKFLNALQKLYPGTSQQQFQKYVRKIYSFEGDLTQFQVDEVDFKMNHHPFYLYNHDKNDDFIIKLFFPATPQQIQQCYSFSRRIDQIVQPQAQNQNGFRILVDAEQSYVQYAIECFSEQMQGRYNKQKIYIIPTIQNYLKRSVQRAEYQIQIARRKNVKFGAKLVRGAYIVEEFKLAEQNGYSNPIVENFEKTTQNYLKSFQIMAKAFDDGQIIVATHNEDTIHDCQKIYTESGSKITLSFAQLLGLADHLTWKVNAQGYTVYKYLPWAKTEVMVAYMIRRAQQLSQMRYPLDTQYGLLKHELKQRYLG